MILDGETTKTKLVDIEKLYNFVVKNIFIGNIYSNVHLKNRLSII